MSKHRTKNGLSPYNYDTQNNLHHLNGEGLSLVFEDKYLSHVQGKVLTLLEALVPEMSVERKLAIKSLVNDAFWGDMHNGWACPMNDDRWDELVLEMTAS